MNAAMSSLRTALYAEGNCWVASRKVTEAQVIAQAQAWIDDARTTASCRAWLISLLTN